MEPTKLCELPRLENSLQNSWSVLQKFSPKYAQELSGGTSQVLALTGEKLRTRNYSNFSKDLLSLTKWKKKKNSQNQENSYRKSSSAIFLNKDPVPQRGMCKAGSSAPLRGFQLSRLKWVIPTPEASEIPKNNLHSLPLFILDVIPCPKYQK